MLGAWAAVWVWYLSITASAELHVIVQQQAGASISPFYTSTSPSDPSLAWLAPLSCPANRKTFRVKQVPGDGACLFNALAEGLRYRHCGVHNDFDGVTGAIAGFLRRMSVEVLLEKLHGSSVLHLDGGATIAARELLDVVAEHYHTTRDEYCAKMRAQSTWGGGPEIVALSNYLRMPIHVYELSASGVFFKSFRLKVTALFGSPVFDACSRPLCVLCCDGRYPHVRPGQQLAVGDHFLALFPEPAPRRRLRLRPWAWSSSTVEPQQPEGVHVGLEDAALHRTLDLITAAATELEQQH